MWHWDQGRLAYFDFDALRAMAQYSLNHDMKVAKKDDLAAATGFSFSVPKGYTPWRNYSRILKSSLLISEDQGVAMPTATAFLLANAGAVTGDEYFHFLVEASTEPNPALSDWTPNAGFRYPLLVVLKYLLAKRAVLAEASATLLELIGMYRATGFTGGEDDTAFIGAVQKAGTYPAIGQQVSETLRRQARESIKVFCQISYLNIKSSRIVVDLDAQDARNIFNDLSPLGGPRAAEANAEIRRIAGLFAAGSAHDFFDYPNTVVNDAVESGFAEGGKVARTHITIERNAALRKAFFATNPATVCDVCGLDTRATYPWTDRVMDLHHLLPLCSGTRVVGQSTTFEDLVALCPSCHRAVHRYYASWFTANQQRDFTNREQAVAIYTRLKQEFTGLVHG